MGLQKGHFMSQQELMPEPQSHQSSQASGRGRQSWSGTEIKAQIHSWPQRSKTTDLPKSDHPATFEDSLPQYRYPVQDQPTLMQQSSSEHSTQWQQQAQSQDAGIGTSTYQPYSQYNAPQQVSWWTQPQENSMDISKWVGLALLVLVMLMSIPVLCSIGTVFVSIIFVFSLLPIIIAFAPIALFLLIPLLRAFGPDDHHHREQRNRYEHSWWW
jgi:hypothetical protein